MRESGYYAPGTEFDPNAPWNQIPSYEIEDKAGQIICKEIEELDEQFLDWLYGQFQLPDEGDVTKDTLDKLVKLLSEDKIIQDDYASYRHDDVVDNMEAEDECAKEMAAIERYESMREERMLRNL